MNNWAQSTGQPGLGYIFWKEEDGKIVGSGPLAKNIGEERTEAVRTQYAAGMDDAVRPHRHARINADSRIDATICADDHFLAD